MTPEELRTLTPFNIDRGGSKPRKLTDQESFQLEQVALLNPSNWKSN